jgi:hypothetical protein
VADDGGNSPESVSSIHASVAKLLERLGYVAITSDESSGGTRIIAITDAGRAALDRLVNILPDSTDGEPTADVIREAVTIKTPTRIETLTSKTRTVRGVSYPGEVLKGHSADVVKSESIRLFGVEHNFYKGPRAFDITFKIGDVAEYDSYNLHYLGAIIGITEKTVTIQEQHGTRRRRLPLREFSWRNWNFDLETVVARNADTMQHI